MGLSSTTRVSALQTVHSLAGPVAAALHADVDAFPLLHRKLSGSSFGTLPVRSDTRSNLEYSNNAVSESLHRVLGSLLRLLVFQLVGSSFLKSKLLLRLELEDQ